MDAFVLLLDSVVEVAFGSLVLLFCSLLETLQFRDEVFWVLEVGFEGIDDFLVSVLHGFGVLGVDSDESVLHVLQLDISLSLYNVYFLFEYRYFSY